MRLFLRVLARFVEEQPTPWGRKEMKARCREPRTGEVKNAAKGM